jgi:hypothetical protein
MQDFVNKSIQSNKRFQLVHLRLGGKQLAGTSFAHFRWVHNLINPLEIKLHDSTKL